MATSKAYLATPETAIVFTQSGGDVAANFDTIATLNGRQSAQHDFGTSPRAFMFNWRAWSTMGTDAAIGDAIDFYYKSGYTTSTRLDNDDGTGDIALSSIEKLRNLHYIGSIVMDEVSQTEMVGSGTVAIYERFIHIVMYNATVDSTDAVANSTGFALTPISIQGQGT
jgi:hypothetical protein